MRPGRLAPLLLMLTLAAGCAPRRATLEECGELLDRVVALELEELGYRDPALVARRQRELRSRLAEDQRQCVGRRLVPRALECARAARSAEELSHRCLK
jgi:hypothetical protein